MKIKKEHLIVIGVVLLLLGLGIGTFLEEERSLMTGLSVGRVDDDIELPTNNENKTKNKHNTKTKNTDKIVIYITGAIIQPGVYEINNNARVIDAVEAAGGEETNADLENINLAATLHDGQQIYIPSIGENDNITVDNKIISKSISSTSSRDKININHASVSQLETLNGIGPSKASNIIQYRENIGKFEDIEQLLDINGIGPATLNKIKDKLILK